MILFEVYQAGKPLESVIYCLNLSYSFSNDIPDPFSASYFLFQITLSFVLLYQGGQGLSTVKTSEINMSQNEVTLLFKISGQLHALIVDTTQNALTVLVK